MGATTRRVRAVRAPTGLEDHVSISVSGTNLASIARPGSGGGSPAEKALREATRDYKEAQDTLVSDVTNHADEDTLKIDRAQLEAAAQAMAQAMAALAQERADAQRARDDARSARQPGPASLVSTADGGLDLFA
ncbi:hypothetical protein GCM10027519_15840 [Kineococcus endophyticus]